MDIYKLLKTDHDKVKKLLTTIESNRDPELFEDLKKEVYLHNEAEEEAFYDPLKVKLGKLKILVKAGHDEHDLVIRMMNQLSKVDSDEEWMTLFSAIKKSLEAHILMEEENIFALGKKHFDNKEAEKMAVDMEKLKVKLAKSYTKNP